MPSSASKTEIAQEERRLRYLRVLVDLTAGLIRQGGLPRSEAEALVAAARLHILDLFPGKEATYDLIYRPRFDRLIREFTRDRVEES